MFPRVLSNAFQAPAVQRDVIKPRGFYHKLQIIEVVAQWEKLHNNDEQWREYVGEQQQKVQAMQEVGLMSFALCGFVAH